jgi:hypothetical protein
LRLTYLSHFLLKKWDGFSTSFPLAAEEVAKASAGHDPLPFLISEIKELVQR